MEVDESYCDSGAEEDSELDTKFNLTVSASSTKFLNYNCVQKICLTQYIMIVDLTSLCLSCAYEIVSGIDDNVEMFHKTEHVTGTFNNLTEKTVRCQICETNLFHFILTEFCLVCNK